MVNTAGARPGARRLAATGAAMAWGGILLQLYLSLRLSVANGKSVAEGLVVFFGYFTILTNILVALALTFAFVERRSAARRLFRRPGVQTAITAAILLVGLAYFFLLRQTWSPEGWQFVADVILHYVTPVAFLGYWWWAVPKRGLRWVDVGAWTLYPLGFFAYAIVRGELTGLYPYPFVDVGALGYGQVLMNAFLLLVAFCAVCLLLIGAGRLQARGQAGAPTALLSVMLAAAAFGAAGCQDVDRDRTARETADEPSSPRADLTGNWTIVGHRLAGVSAMGNAEASEWRGRKLRLTVSEALTSRARCDTPVYDRREVKLDSLLGVGYAVRPSDLGFPAERDRVSILQVVCEGDRWVAMGGTLIGIDDERAFAPWDGVFFVVERDRAADAADSRAKDGERPRAVG